MERKINPIPASPNPSKPHSKKKVVIGTNDRHVEQALDEALKESFPASDPVGIVSEKYMLIKVTSYRDMAKINSF